MFKLPNDEWMSVNCGLSVIVKSGGLITHWFLTDQQWNFNGSAQFVDISWSSSHVVFSIVVSTPWSTGTSVNTLTKSNIVELMP